MSQPEPDTWQRLDLMEREMDEAHEQGDYEKSHRIGNQLLAELLRMNRPAPQEKNDA